jgi:hypothetical protein
VVTAVIGGIASAATGFFLERAGNKRQQNAAAPEVVQNAAPAPNVNFPALPAPGFVNRTVASTPGRSAPVVWPRPEPGFPPPTPPAVPAAIPPAALQPKFEKPKSPPAAADFNGLLAYWPLDEGAGTQALDSQNKRKAALYGGGKWVPGIRGQALEFNGANECLDLGASPELNFAAGAPFTLACWVKSDARSGKVFWFRGHPDGLPIIGVQLVNGKLQGWVRNDGGIFHPHSFGGEVTGKEPLRSGEWHHVALARTAAGEPLLFQDGRLVDRAKGGRETQGRITTNVRALGVDAHAMLKNPRDGEVQPLVGCVDEFCVFNRVLTEEEVAKLAGREP